MKSTLYTGIAKNLKMRIRQNVFENDRLPSERQMAIDYNINRITLRKALNILFEEGLITKISTKGTFVAKGNAVKKEITGKKIAFFLIDRNIGNSFHGTIISHLQKCLQENNNSLLFYYIRNHNDLDNILRSKAKCKEIDGVIVHGLTTPALLKKMKRLKSPIVLLGHLMRADLIEEQFDQIAENCFDYAYKATKMLIKQGGEKIAFVDGPSYQWGMQAQTGYMKALEESNIKYHEKFICRCDRETISNGVKMAKQIATLKPSAIFVRSETLMRGLYDGFQALGIKIPEDINIISLGHPGDSIEHLDLIRIVLDPIDFAEKARDVLMKRLLFPRLEVIKENIKFKIKK